MKFTVSVNKFHKEKLNSPRNLKLFTFQENKKYISLLEISWMTFTFVQSVLLFPECKKNQMRLNIFYGNMFYKALSSNWFISGLSHFPFMR